MLAEELQSLLQARRSIRRYQPDPVPPETLERLLTAAIWAPSAHNRQPWRFATLTAPAAKARLAQAMGQRLRADRLADGDALEVVEADARKSLARISGAPAVVVVCLTLADMDHYLDARRAQAEYLMAVQSVAMAVQNLLLAAHAEGLGACWMCAPLFCGDAVRQSLDLPSEWQPQALVTLGRPASAGTLRAAARRPAAERSLAR